MSGEVVERVAAVSFVHVDDTSHAFEVRAEWRDEDKYAVVHHRRVLNEAAEWEWEPQPSSRTDEFKARTRFDLETARRLAREQAAKLYPEYVAAHTRPAR